MTAMPSDHAASDGLASPSLAAYYLERARGGVGLIVVEPAFALPPEEPRPKHLGLYDDAQVPRLRECLCAVRSYGAIALMMIDQPLSVRHASEQRLAEIAEAWAAAAWRAHVAGADGVMFSCADGGPLDQLLSSLMNQRTDHYGGDMSGRAKLLLDLLERVRSWMGARLLVGVRLNVGEFGVRGQPLHDARVVAKRLAAAGADLLEVSTEPPDDVPVARFPGWRVPLAAEIKAVVDIPVMVGGLMADAELADSVIREGSADMVALGATLRSEPHWPLHARDVLAGR